MKTTEKYQQNINKFKSKVTNNLRKVPLSKIKLNTFLSISAIILSISSISFSLTTYIYRPTKTNLNQELNTEQNNLPKENLNIPSVINTTTPSVVSIITESTEQNWFGPRNVKSGAGTGFILSKDGYIATNKHVVNGANKVSIALHDGTIYDNVSVVDVDPNNDIAFLKVDNVNNFTPIKLGDSKKIILGQPVIAIGNALGEFQNTATSGIISGIGRSIIASDSTRSMTESLVDMIQTDASINPGNSGGPLINLAGEVIGINTAVSQAGQNIGFAIPVSSIKGIINQLIKTGKVERPYIGIYYTSITPAVAKNYNLPVSNGAYVFTTQKYSAIIKDSPADKAGLKDKDIITAIAGTKVDKKNSVGSLIGEFSVGDTIDINIIRDNKEMSLKIKLEPFPKN